MTQRNALIFGGFGGIGSATHAALRDGGFDVTRTGRIPSDEPNTLTLDLAGSDLSPLDSLSPLDVVVWAHGRSPHDTAADFEAATLRQTIDVNCIAVATTLQHLLQRDKINNGARLCVVSSIRQEYARPERFSYSISKAALGGLVRSAAIDLADRSILINAVLPGVVETAMAKHPGSSASAFKQWTPHARNLDAEEVADVIAYLCSDKNRSVTGQSITVDLGSTTSRIPFPG